MIAVMRQQGFYTTKGDMRVKFEAQWLHNDIKANRKGKDSVFTDLFNIPKYAVQMAQAIDKELVVTESDIQIVSLRTVLLNNVYNDLGMLIKDKLLLCSEAQSTWSINILPRMFLYVANILQQYINRHEDWNIYGSRKITIPQPILTLIYSGDKKNIPNIISLSEEFFKGGFTI